MIGSMNNFTALPATVSTRDIQRSYTSIFKQVDESKQPVLVISNNKPRAAIISLDAYNEYAHYLADKKSKKNQRKKR
jgi:PHD/YefM family antitoxin component YafN of YafNO toxin-antitoxin module